MKTILNKRLSIQVSEVYAFPDGLYANTVEEFIHINFGKIGFHYRSGFYDGLPYFSLGLGLLGIGYCKAHSWNKVYQDTH